MTEDIKIQKAITKEWAKANIAGNSYSSPNRQYKYYNGWHKRDTKPTTPAPKSKNRGDI